MAGSDAKPDLDEIIYEATPSAGFSYWSYLGLSARRESTSQAHQNLGHSARSITQWFREGRSRASIPSAALMHPACRRGRRFKSSHPDQACACVLSASSQERSDFSCSKSTVLRTELRVVELVNQAVAAGVFYWKKAEGYRTAALSAEQFAC